MRIYRMTATFGKLEGQTLTLEPGLNVITAPNEWGKSTWCAFLLAMLYGLDTRAKSTKTSLADKERYRPWSGSPMEGRIDLNWEGRDITIERGTKGRIPLGEFFAYETASGLPVGELTADNCGKILLGVERSVFCRAGFIRGADLPVTQDEAMRRRLNDLVTTGDESGRGDRLAESLKELKNRCRYNRSGLLPQAQAHRAELQGKLAELELLQTQCAELKQKLTELQTRRDRLDNHRQALAYAQAQTSARHLAQAREECDRLEEDLRTREAACQDLPPLEDARQRLWELRGFLEQWDAMEMEQQLIPDAPDEPRLPPPYVGMPLEEARKMAAEDRQNYAAAANVRLSVLLLIMGTLGLGAMGLLAALRAYVPAVIAGSASVVSLVWGVLERRAGKKLRKVLRQKYGTDEPARWEEPLDVYESELARCQEHMKTYRESSADLEVRMVMLNKRRGELCGDAEPETLLTYWEHVQSSWEACLTARREAHRGRSHLEALTQLARPVEAPRQEDHLTESEEQTQALLEQCREEQQRLQNRLGQCQGRMDSLGRREELENQLALEEDRIQALEKTYRALTVAQETLDQARAELQRRYAPKITRRAGDFLARMTDGRYHSLTMGQDFSLRAAAGEEGILRDIQWRSDGTVDQLYLAMRLAVAEVLTPGAPLILDDALARFDDRRLKAAMELLKDLAKDRQIVCFTCQSREKGAG